MNTRTRPRLYTLNAAVTLLLAAWSQAGCQSPTTVSDERLTVTEQVTLAGKLQPRAIAGLQSQNAVVIDLRTDTEPGQRAEQRRMQKLGVRYHQLPIDGAVVSGRDTRALAELLEASGNQPVVIHCASGNRAAMLWAAYRISEGDALANAEAAVAPLATKEAITEAIRTFAAQHAESVAD